MASDEPTEITELVGRELGERYRLERVLGAGAMGAVFEASDRRLQRAVAVKVMQPGYARAVEYVERFLREAQAASKIRHRNVVTVLDHGQVEGELVYSVMELLVGQDLEQFLLEQPGQRVGWAQARDLLVQLASGLRAAHRQGVIHRDIKPANCVLTTEDDELVVKVVDFGIAKLSEGAQTQELTGTGNVLGTASYTAPERVLSHAPATPRSDVYSLGVVAYRMLTGRLPFTGKTSFEVMHHACIEPVPAMREPGVELPAAMEALVLEMLSKTPEQRPADMGEVRHRLLAIGREGRDEGVGATSPIGVGAGERAGSTSSRIEVGEGERSGSTPSRLAVGEGERSGSTPSRLEVVAGERAGSTSSRLELGARERAGSTSSPVEVGAREVVWPTSSPLDVREGGGAESTSSSVEDHTVVGMGAHAVEVAAGKVLPTEVLGRATQQEPSEPAAGEQAGFDPTARVPVSRWRKTEPVEQSPGATESSEVDRTVVAPAPSGPLAPFAARSEPVEQGPVATESSELDRTVVAPAPSAPLAPVAAALAGSMGQPWGPGSAVLGAAGSMGREWTQQPVVEDAGSLPWMGTVPVADDEPLRSRAATKVLAYALVGAFVMSVIVGVILSLDGDDEPSEVVTPATARVDEPAEVAAASQTEAKGPSAPPELDEEAPSAPSEADAEAPSTPLPEPGEDAPSAPPSEADAESPSTPLPEPDAPPVAEEPPETKVEAQRPKKPKKPAGPPSDAELKKTLARRIKARCAAEMTSGRATVVFDVTPSGEIKRLTAIPKGAAGECAKRQVAGTRFRPRARDTNVEIEVTRAS